MPGLSVVIVIASEQLVDISVLVRPWYLRAEWRDVHGLYRGEV
jgi:phage head maturation protease